jgi:hypothetical protein
MAVCSTASIGEYSIANAWGQDSSGGGRLWSSRRARSEESGFVQQLLQVSHPMHDGDDLNRLGLGAIDNDDRLAALILSCAM